MENKGYSLEEVLPVVADLSSAYCGYEHSSVTYEKAQMLMEAVLYCINEFEKSADNTLWQDGVSVREAYETGQKIVIEKVRKLQELYNELILDFQDYGSVCLRDTIVKGIPCFLSRYDFKYAPQETLLILDYPILKNPGTLSGVDRVLEYLECICLEQEFLRKLDDRYVIEILQEYHSDYEQLIQNICEVILQNMIGHILLDKPFDSKGFDKDELEALAYRLQNRSTQEIETHVAEVLRLLIINYYNGNVFLLDYLSCGISNIVAGMQCRNS